MKKIKYQDFILLHNPILIDVRDKYEFQDYHLDKAINIPFHLLWKYPEKYLSFTNTYFIICAEGYRSKKISKHLRKLKYTTISIIHGYKRIKRS